MNQSVKRRRTPVNYARLASGDVEKDGEEEAKEVLDKGFPVEDEEDGDNSLFILSAKETRRQRSSTRTVRRLKLKVDDAEEKPSVAIKVKSEKSRKERPVHSDASDETEQFGYDCDDSEDFVPGKLGASTRGEEEDDNVIDEEVEEDEEEVRDSIEAGTRLSRGKSVDVKGARIVIGRSLHNSSLGTDRNKLSASQQGRPQVGQSLTHSLSGRRVEHGTLASPSSSMMKGAHGRLLKKIGFKAPLVAASTAKVPEVLKSRPHGKEHMNQELTDVGKSTEIAQTNVKKEKVPSKAVELQPWLRVQGSGKFEKRYTAFLDDAALQSPVQSNQIESAEGAVGGDTSNDGKAVEEASASLQQHELGASDASALAFESGMLHQQDVETTSGLD